MKHKQSLNRLKKHVRQKYKYTYKIKGGFYDKKKAKENFKKLNKLPFGPREKYKRYGKWVDPHRDLISYSLEEGITNEYGKRTVKPEKDCPDFLKKMVEKAN